MKHTFFQKVKSQFTWEGFAIGVLLIIGFVLRLRQYLTGRSLWLDEAMLALNIVNRNFANLFLPLDYDQGAPIGFLLVEKGFNVLFGDHEFVLRLFPFVAGGSALCLFYLLLRRTASGIGLLAGLALFAVSPDLINYSSEAKQYILDVTVTIVLLYLSFPLMQDSLEKRYYVYLGSAGVLALWFSHPALFVLAGIGIGLCLQVIKRRERSHILSLMMLGVLWLANLGLLYFVSLRGLSQNAFLLDFWGENFMPVPPWSDWGWFGIVFRGLTQNQVGIQVSAWLISICVLLGFIALFTKNKSYAGVIIFIFAFALIASAMRLYPFGGRLSLFLVPLIVILISHTIQAIDQQLNTRYKFGSFIALLLSGYLLYAPATESIANFSNPKYFEHIRPSMATLSENWKEGDTIYISNGAVPAFRFYAERYGLGDVVYQSSDASDYLEPSNILSQIKPLDDKTRVWVLITHVYENKGFNEKDFLLNYLDTLGSEEREFQSPGTSVYLYLYDLSQ